MTILSVFEPPEPPADRLDRAERLVFVKEGFAWSAFVIPPFYFLWRRNVPGLLVYIAGTGLIAGLAWLFDLGSGPVSVMNLGLGAILGFEASNLERYALARKGFTELGTVSGESLAQCERRFFDTWLPGQPILATAAATAYDAAHVPPRRGRILGRFLGRGLGRGEGTA